MNRHATPPAFSPTAARAADQLDRRLSGPAAKSLLNRIERLRREEEIAELRRQLEDVEFELAVVQSPHEKKIRADLAKRIKAYIARSTGEAQ